MRNSSVAYMLFFISGSDGSIGYSFFSEAELTAASVNLGATGEDGDPFSVDDKGAAERGLDELTDSGTTITSTGRFPLASTQLIFAPADKSSLTASTALTEPPEAAQ
ncbi:hypothetical protein KIW84_055799 [Lathyrus oleraceus]|uniref:Uncharacterized protein n=1 Tax=Pisum sativum TaxID=3888 RepID=A0A9D4WWJ8_PEA|nr:hypothetical protein KIW84_055799 [Pisum sativum]